MAQTKERQRRFRIGNALLVSLILVFSVFLGACDSVEHVVAQTIKGDITGEVGKEYTTEWFTFTINSCERTTSYGGREAFEGEEFVVVEIVEKNITSVTQPFGATDWYLSGGNLTEELYPIVAFDSSMMPEEFDLKPDQEATYICVFEIDAGQSDLFLVYEEINEKNELFATFKVKV